MPTDHPRLMGFPPRAEPAEKHRIVEAFAELIGWNTATSGGCMECTWAGRWRMFDLTASIDEAAHKVAHRVHLIRTHAFLCADCDASAKRCARSIRRGHIKCCWNCEHNPQKEKR